ncbi:Kae1-associated serine/threonine protein kinase [Candidatus Woesearchaeota archaeon]|nr:Kae1-associated serine/threonine protein kinase [Candidatus Woesearchaeota archaeon]
MKEIARGAEAVLYLDNGKLIKDRVKKNYRIDEIDNALRKMRTKREVKLLEKSSELINVPNVIKSGEGKIVMDFIEGKLCRDFLNDLSKSRRKKICKDIGSTIKKLHDGDIIHGDLTTSNMILKEGKVYFIDFGLGFVSSKIEDKAVDLHLLKQALTSKHYEIADECFNEIFKAYKPDKNFLERFDKVEGRGRYKGRA